MRVLLAIILIALGIAYYLEEYRRFAYQMCDDLSCVREILSRRLESHGINSAARDLAHVYGAAPWVRPSCFALALGLGEKLAGTSSEPGDFEITPITTVCNYGIYQSYPRSLLLNGTPKADVAHFCTRVGASIGRAVPDAEAECFRGIGRGLPFMDGQHEVQYMASRAVDECKSLAPDRHSYSYCIAGVFNILARDSVSGTNGLTINMSDPLWLCGLQTGEERQICLGNWKWTAVALLSASNSLEDIPRIGIGLDALEKKYGFSTPFAREIASSLGYEEARRNAASSNDSQAIIACQSAPSDIVEQCLNGYAIGLAKHGMPLGQYRRVIRFCDEAQKMIPGSDVSTCAHDAIEYLHGAYPPSVQKRMCSRVRELGISCTELLNRGSQ